MTQAKERRVPVRPRQRKAAELIVANALLKHPKHTGQILESIGYSKGISETPSMVTESQGFKQALREMGLTEELITAALVEDIEKKKQNRLGELRLGAELLGINKRDDEPSTLTKTTYNFIFAPEAQAKIKAMDAELKILLTQNVQENKET